MKFKKVELPKVFMLENQNGVKEVENEHDIKNFFDIMCNDEDQHIILTSPRIVENVQYVQAARNKDLIDVQLGILEQDATILYDAFFNEEEAIKVFNDFYHGQFVVDYDKFKLLEFR